MWRLAVLENYDGERHRTGREAEGPSTSSGRRRGLRPGPPARRAAPEADAAAPAPGTSQGTRPLASASSYARRAAATRNRRNRNRRRNRSCDGREYVEVGDELLPLTRSKKIKTGIKSRKVGCEATVAKYRI